jgi:Xaa-Pro aminopeptidase
VKRGLITWNRTELPPQVFERRMDSVRRVLVEHQLPALVVYSDLWRSNQARFFANYMPYFNRALLLLPLEGKPALLCGLSPRTYRWIQSVTPIEDVRPAGNFAKPLAEIALERGWKKVGVLDADHMPYDLAKTLHAAPVELVNIEASLVFKPAQDEHEIAMRREAAAMARKALEEELPSGVGMIDYEFVGRLETRLRMAGAEDLVILLTNGNGAPAPARGRTLEAGYGLSIALEYRGHWVRMSKLQAGITHEEEHLAGSYPYECGPGGDIRYVDGDTQWRSPGGWEVL